MYLSREQVRALDRRAIEEFGVPGVVLMENAGRGAAEVLISLDCKGPVLICCGKGNNGGDGFVIARHLDNQQIPVRVLLFAEPSKLTGDAAVNYQIIARSGLEISVYHDELLNEAQLRSRLAQAEWIVDALFGTGLTGPVRKPFDQVIQCINEANRHVLAVDIPSGLDCDTGQPLGPTVRAEHTVTFVAQKKGFANPLAKNWTGQVHVADIGAPRCLLE
ncbi:MAG TPA: NAD(P)H-hydrate epimerase [Gemmataceae bacterium]|jgi:NAD(P)H-hydrate epimerase|nr:NAD(P)H-hydrate epimerase [Gemmataceae bacterium]